MRALIYMAIAILITPFVSTSFAFDVDGDGKEGLVESIHALQVVAGIIPATSVDCNAPDEVLSLGKCWKDRNLGANRVAESVDDSDAYGDLYQWGRPRDGHQHRTSGVETTRSVYDDPEHDDYIRPPGNPYDWRDPPNDNLWQGVGGINNPCPQGFRIPTAAELNAELESWGSGNQNRKGAFASPLKLTVAGLRSPDTGGISHGDLYGYYWSSTIIAGARSARYLVFSETSANITTDVRAVGYSVRCIKDLNYSEIALIGEALGEGCTSGDECLSGNCVDGVCCNSSCTSECESCDLPGSEGICKFIPFGNDPANECKPGTCNGTGECVNTCTDGEKNLDETDIDCGGDTCPQCVSGQACEISSDCESGICDKEVCS